MSVIKLHESVDGKTKFVVRNVLPHQIPVLAAINSKNHIPTHVPPHTHTHARACVHTYKVNTVSWHLVERLSQPRKLASRLIFRPRTPQLRHKSDYYLLHLVACINTSRQSKTKSIPTVCKGQWLSDTIQKQCPV